MKRVILIILTVVGLLKADENVLKVVINLTTSDVNKFERSILQGIATNKAHYESTFKELDVIAVIHGGAYKFFIKDLSSSEYKYDQALLEVQENFKKRLKSINDTYGVKFLMCGAGMRKHKIKEEDVYDYVKIIPNAMIGLIDAQNNGYAYVPVE